MMNFDDLKDFEVQLYPEGVSLYFSKDSDLGKVIFRHHMTYISLIEFHAMLESAVISSQGLEYLPDVPVEKLRPGDILDNLGEVSSVNKSSVDESRFLIHIKGSFKCVIVDSGSLFSVKRSIE